MHVCTIAPGGDRPVRRRPARERVAAGEPGSGSPTAGSWSGPVEGHDRCGSAGRAGAGPP
ncbi:hypothetical protein KPATCC21470_4948 [Kitasatospora purpeofusca]